MKIIAVICNNIREWKYFVDTVEFSMSKQNKRYKTKDDYVIDIENNYKYIMTPNSYSGISKLRGIELYTYTSMASNIDDELFNYLRSV